MQTLAFEIATTFVDDAAALLTGAARIILGLLSAPIERLAAACDVAGVLPERRLQRLMPRAGGIAAFRRWRPRGCLEGLRALRKLT